MKFEDFELSPVIHDGLRDVQFTEPTPIQEKGIPVILEGRDLIGSAQTGTGKTGAFVIPMLDHMVRSPGNHIQALILTPTRELARQIDEQIFAIGYHTGVSSATVIGGSDFAEQARAIKGGVNIIVATPGRLMDQMNILNIDFSKLEYLVLDEADRMLDMGFWPDVKKIISDLPADRQTLLFSATLPPEIEKVIPKIMKNPERVAIKASKPAENVEQQVYYVNHKDKLKLIEHLFDELKWDSTIIFTATKRGTDELERLLKKRDIKTVSMHGDRSQDERNEALRAFKNRQYPVMVATDVLARGIDIDNVSVIINYDVPNNSDDYIHRIGRTGRYDKKGLAITFVSPKDKSTFSSIHKVVGDKLAVKEFSGKEPARDRGRDSQKKERPSGRQSKSEKPDRKKPRPTSSRNGSGDRDDRSKGKAREQKGSSGKRQQRRPDDEQKSKEEIGEQIANYYQEGLEPSIEIVEKAVSRNHRARKPAKGIWGIVKSMIPKIKS